MFGRKDIKVTRPSFSSIINKANSFQNPDDPKYVLDEIGEGAKYKSKVEKIKQEQLKIPTQKIKHLGKIIAHRTIEEAYSKSKLRLMQQ